MLLHLIPRRGAQALTKSPMLQMQESKEVILTHRTISPRVAISTLTAFTMLQVSLDQTVQEAQQRQLVNTMMAAPLTTFLSTKGSIWDSQEIVIKTWKKRKKQMALKLWPWDGSRSSLPRSGECTTELHTWTKNCIYTTRASPASRTWKCSQSWNASILRVMVSYQISLIFLISNFE